MRAGLSTILQTLTPEAAGVLNQSAAEAARRGHGQTTPLHVAATLLASHTGLLRQACVRSHPATSHPLQCRALELCFSVALDRLPSSNASAAASASSGSNGVSGAKGSRHREHAGAATRGGLEQPPLSNALMAAIKRAQANQRRGCPEQQQQPLLAVKVELGHLVVSILDDPGVSRVMREASFSSPAVKATIEQSFLPSAASSPSPSPSVSGKPLPLGGRGAGRILGVLGFPPARSAPGTPFLPADRSLYLNPLLEQHQKQQQGTGGRGGDAIAQEGNETLKVLNVLLRTRKRNPILVGDSHLEELMRDALQKIERREVAADGPLGNVEVIPLEKQLASSDRSQIPHKLQELVNSLDVRFAYAAASAGGVILDLGDLKWLVDSPCGGLGFTFGHNRQQATMEMGRAVVSAMAKLLSRFTGGSGSGSSRVWLVGRASSATYLRCQVNHPTMEVDWDLQAIAVAARAPVTSALSRAGNNGVMGSSLTHPKRLLQIGAATLPARRPPSEDPDASRNEMCPVCKDSYEHELATLVAKEFEKSSSESKAETRQTLPPWLQIVNLGTGASKPTATQLQTKGQELMWKQTTEELLKRWTETCTRLHPHLRQPATTLEATNLCNSGLLIRESAQTKLVPDSSIRMSSNGGPTAASAARPPSPPGSPVGTDLALGRAKPPPSEQSVEESAVPEVVRFVADGFAAGDDREKSSGGLDFDSFKRLFRGLTAKVSWQPEAATAVATAVMQSKSGAGKRRSAGRPRGDTWLLFSGPDKVGKGQMAVALSDIVVGAAPVTVRFGNPRADGDVSSRGKTAFDRVAEAVRRDPFSVVVLLENVDRADALVVGGLRRAMERGRLVDSHGREVALGNTIFVLISEASPEEPDGPLQKLKQSEEKLLAAARSGWELELLVGETKKQQPGKRRADWLSEEDHPAAKPKRRPPSLGLSLDLNLNLAASAAEEDTADSSRNSSDLTTEHEHSECGRLPVPSGLPTSLLPAELVGAVDEAVTFKPVDFGELRRKVSETITRKFQTAAGETLSLCIDEEALDMVVGAVWFGAAPAAGFEEWVDRMLVPGFRRLRSLAAEDGSAMVRLSPDKDGCSSQGGGMEAAPLPGRVRVAVERGGSW